MSTKRLHLFQAYGIELEYMIAKKEDLSVNPITDELFKNVTGEYVSDVERGEITWCNELVMHVVELKCTEPNPNLVGLNEHFHKNVKDINTLLAGFNSQLMPTAAHPFMDPQTEAKLWPHDNNEVYERYNKMFNCKGHGWSNLQSTHINLPFYDDEEFATLHAAIRLILPLIPGIAASSPVLGGKNTGMLDKRMDYYQKNQKVIPSITGKVIPERVFSKRQYHKVIYDKISHDIEKYNEDKILDPIWVNSRGAIARFDRGSIEIRIMDIQECPQADLAIVSLIVAALKMLVEEKTCSFHNQQLWETEDLNAILQKTIVECENAVIENSEYLKVFGIDAKSSKVSEVWRHILNATNKYYPTMIDPYLPTLEFIINEGTLATRIVKALDGQYGLDNIRLVYRELSDCLNNNELFEVCLQEKF
ncbi:glutamate-cysteine ligase family protein [Fulvivirga lutea]|uniref:Glutamate--cysteine ligase n=1 Tax=Fulvivirga lutea TaxID=2810512 RepID=A0A974WKJ8_9BACT|nr:glutamate-cysteine ligase family protein [Fulvivirga lutea]QSE97865.1 glutamate--cysteine ligase [Fulvivirga lutea]